MKPILLSALAGFVIALLGVGTVALSSLGKQESDVKRGWNPKRALVFTQDVGEGSPVTAESIVESTFPEQFVTGSAVPPEDAALVIGQTPGFPQQKGDVVVWGAFILPFGHSKVGSCVKEIREGAQSASDAAANASIDVFEQGYAPPAKAGALPALPASDSSGMIAVVSAAVDVPEFKELTPEMLELTLVPERLVTQSHVPGAHLKAIIGDRLMVPTLKGDLLLWQQLEEPEGAHSAATCSSRALEASTVVRASRALELAKAYVAGLKEAP